jgi:hypothetical protein
MHVVLPPGTAARDLSPLRTLECANPGWISMLAEALHRLREAEPGLARVVTLLDDHCPLAPCDAPRLDTILRVAEAEALACISFVTYDWPWDHSDPASRDERGRTMTWPRRDVRILQGEAFAVVPMDFFRYNQCQPSVWDLGYLEDLCAQALARGLDDPWSFENELFARQRPHFVSAYRWPTVHHGFLASGRVNPAALFHPGKAGPEVKRLRAFIRGRFIRERGRAALLAERISGPAWVLRRAAGRLRRKLT